MGKNSGDLLSRNPHLSSRTKFVSDDWMIERDYLEEDEIEGGKEW